MASLRRKSPVLIPQCSGLEVRLTPSGSFLSHGYADVVREVNRVDHHHSSGHAHEHRETILGHEMPVHYDHVNAGHVAK